MSATEWTEPDPSRTGTPSQSPNPRVRALPGAIATVGVTALLWMQSGPVGLVGGGVLFVSWAVLPATYAFAVGQIVFVAVTRPAGGLEGGLLPLALIELGLAGVLVGPDLRSADSRRTAVWTLLGGGLLAGVALASYALWDRVWVAATVLLGIGALGAYGLHRYELVVLGKVPDPDDEGGVGPEDVGTDVVGELGRSDDEPASGDEPTPEGGRVDSYATEGADPDAEGGEAA